LKTALPVLAGVVVLAAGWWLLQRGPRPALQGPRAAAAPREPSATSADRAALLALGAEVKQLRAELGQAKQSALAAVTPAVAPQQQADSGPVDERHAAQLRAQALEARFQAEPRDSGWSADMENRILASFQGPASAGTSLISVRCAATLCRLSVRHADDAARRDLAAQIAEKAPFAAGVHYVYSPDDLHDTTLYVSRPGK
jgi:hypothetical protein